MCAERDPIRHFEALAWLDPDAHFTWDTKMAAFHGQTEALYQPENAWLWKHIRHMHINDYAGGYRDWEHLKTLHPGRGTVDFDRLFQFLPTAGYQGDFTVEATSFLPDGVIHWEELNRTFDHLRALIR